MFGFIFVLIFNFQNLNFNFVFKKSLLIIIIICYSFILGNFKQWFFSLPHQMVLFFFHKNIPNILTNINLKDMSFTWEKISLKMKSY